MRTQVKTTKEEHVRIELQKLTFIAGARLHYNGASWRHKVSDTGRLPRVMRRWSKLRPAENQCNPYDFLEMQVDSTSVLSAVFIGPRIPTH